MSELRRAAQQALDAIDRALPYAPHRGEFDALADAADALRAALAEPVQEPVAWRHRHIEGVAVTHRPADIDRYPERWAALYPEAKPCPTCEALARTVMMDQTAHDLFLPPRQWQGLTDEEIIDVLHPLVMADMSDEATDYEIARTIEAKLREKNA